MDLSGLDFELLAHDGSRISLSSFRGRYLVLYFYPRAFTPGCSREAAEFNRVYEEFRRLGVEVLGVSTDSPDRNRRFAERIGLHFKVASDPGGRLSRALGVLRGFGPFRYAGRVTFIIDPGGRVVKVLRGFRRPEDHALKALEEVRRLIGEGGSVG